MATTIFPTSKPKGATATFSTATTRCMTFARGSGSTTQTDNTVASLVTAANPQGTGTVAPALRAAGITLAAAGTVETGATIGASLFFVSDPIKAITISSSITANLRASESAVAANYAIGCKIYRVRGNVVDTAFAQGSNITELGTSDGALSITLTPTSTAFLDGDAIGLLIYYVSPSGSTSASGRTAALTYNGASSGAAGDTFLTFTDTIAQAPVRPEEMIGAQQGVKRAALFCLGEKWARTKKSGLWVPSPERPYAFA